MNCKLQFLNYGIREKTQYISNHKHGCYELVYYIKGAGCSIIDDTAYNYGNGTFSIIKPEIYHDEKHSVNTDLIYIGFDYEGVALTLYNGMYADDLNQSILTLLKDMKKELLHKESYYDIKLNLLMTQLLIEFGRINEKSGYMKNELTYVYKFIKENYNQKIDMKALAELSGYSYHRFRHIFKEQTGLSPINFIIKTRIDNALQLLKNTELPISRISSECGFSTTSQFCMQFKEVIGSTPAGYREQIFREE